MRLRPCKPAPVIRGRQLAQQRPRRCWTAHFKVNSVKTRHYVQIVARATFFPDVIEIDYLPLDKDGRRTGGRYVGDKFPWEEVQRRFWIDSSYAKECEGFFADGDAANLGNHMVMADFSEAEKKNLHPYERAPIVGAIVTIQGHWNAAFEIKLVDFETKTFDAEDIKTKFPLKNIPWGAIVPHAPPPGTRDALIYRCPSSGRN